MLRVLIGFVLGAASLWALMFFGVLTPRTVRVTTRNPRQGVQQVTDNVIRQVRSGVKNLRTEAEAAAMVQAKTGQRAVCHREGLSTRHVCRTAGNKIYRVMGTQVILFKGDLKDLDKDLESWAKKAAGDLLKGQKQQASPVNSGSKDQQAVPVRAQ